MSAELDLTDARDYLSNGGLGETLGLAYMAAEMQAQKVTIDTDMAIVLCEMAQKGLEGHGG